MGVVSHGYGGLGGIWMYVVDGMHARQCQGGWSHVGRCRNTPRVRGDALMLPITSPSWCAVQGRVEPELVGLQGEVLTWDATRRLRLVYSLCVHEKVSVSNASIHYD